MIILVGEGGVVPPFSTALVSSEIPISGTQYKYVFDTAY